MWGQVKLFKLVRHVYRIIPTRVGTSTIHTAGKCTMWDHPHACGDKLLPSRISSAPAGSSPRVWGQEDYDFIGRRKSGIIPTRVGTSGERGKNRRNHQDHPHACGDKNVLSSASEDYDGSSPRVWGQGCVTSVYPVAVGIIPTRVGTRTSKYVQIC